MVERQNGQTSRTDKITQLRSWILPTRLLWFRHRVGPASTASAGPVLEYRLQPPAIFPSVGRRGLAAAGPTLGCAKVVFFESFRFIRVLFPVSRATHQQVCVIQSQRDDMW